MSGGCCWCHFDWLCEIFVYSAFFVSIYLTPMHIKAFSTAAWWELTVATVRERD